MTTIRPNAPPVNPDPAPERGRTLNRAPRGGMVSPVNGRHYRGGWFMPATPPAVPAAPAAARVQIAGFRYEVREIPAGECGTVAFEVFKLDTNNHYAVIRNHFGQVTCDCPDYEIRKAGTGRMCKHGAALVARGMVAPPSEPEPPFDGRALWAWARAHRAVGVVAAFGRANELPGLIVGWTVEQATDAYFQVAEAMEGGAR